MQQVDDPPFLPVGTEVSAKYKGAFCEAKVRKVVRNIKCKIAYKQGLGSGTVSDELIKGVLRVGASVEVKHPDKREYVEATITKIQDCSQYTVVFDDGDITTLRRTALCLKSGRHFNESETLDQLPLTHPEHFGNPVIGGRRGRRSRHLHDDSSDDEDENDSKEVINEKEEHIGKVVCVESTETKKKDKEKWFPALVVSPTAQVTVRIRVKDEYLVRSFKDGRYYTVPKKEAMEFTREMAVKQDGTAVQAALQYLDNSTLPPHWDKDALFGLANSSSEYEGELDSDSSDDEPREEKDHFVAQLYKYMDDRGTPLNKVPSITNRDVDLYRLFRAVQKHGGYNRVTAQNQWKVITMRLGFIPVTVSVTNLVKQAYKKFLQPFEEFDRKLGCSMSMTPRNANRSKGRSLVRANSVASPKPEVKDLKPIPPIADESENTSESSSDISKSKRKLSTGSGKVKAIVEKFEEKIKEEPPPVEPVTVVAKSAKVKETKDDLPLASAVSVNKKEKAVKKVPQEEKRSSRKKREGAVETDTKPTEVTVSDKDFTIDVGDKLSVYYHEKKVTYEAKVIETSLQQNVPFYLVHYTGWNTRYDEWVPRERIAENLTTNKSKRVKGSSTVTSQKANSNVPPNDGNKGAGNVTDKGGLTVTTLTTNLPTTKTMTVSKRGRGRSDSQPPRSITPSSMAATSSSSSGRTKSPAAQTVRRTTRAQPSTSRRTSNNVSDVSMPTDSDSDSDTPVKKPIKTPAQIISVLSSSPGPLAMLGKSGSAKTSVTTNSQSETEEEELLTTTKGRDYDLSQIRSELKGFKELKSPSPESEANAAGEKKPDVFNFETMAEEIGKKPTLSVALPKSIIEVSKASSTDQSSETDSFGDDDSQSSDKTTTLENMTEKFQQKIAQGKCLERLGSDKLSMKKSGIEKIIEDSLAEKMQESLKAKPFTIIEKSLFKSADTEMKTEPGELASQSGKMTSLTERKTPKGGLQQPEKKHLIDSKPISIKAEKKLSNLTDSIKTSIKKESPSSSNESMGLEKMSLKSPGSSTDIYEFKEPEPFEFEVRKSSVTSNILGSPEMEKKPKKFGGNKTVEPIADTKPIAVPATSAGKKNKRSPIKDSDKAKVAKIDEKPIPLENPNPLLIPSKIETTFDALRKSPSFNLNISTGGIEENPQQQQSEGIKPVAVLESVSPEKLPTTPPPPVPPSVPPPIQPSEPLKKSIPFISPFVETLKDSPKVFDLKADVSAIDKESPDKSSGKTGELETVKRVLAHDPALNLPPPKSDKWKVSIADKLLKAFNQQKEEQKEPKPKDELPLCPPVIEAPQISSSSFAVVSAATTLSTELPKIELPAIIKKEIEIPLKKPILSSPEQKLDILESIAPKNNDLSETIQKLESVIRHQAKEVDQYDENSSESTDSEQRLVIQDDFRESSETNETDIATETGGETKKSFGEESPFLDGRESCASFQIDSPSRPKSAFNLQMSLTATTSSTGGLTTESIAASTIVSDPEIPGEQFKLSEEVTLKQLDKSPSDLHLSSLSFSIKKEDIVCGGSEATAGAAVSMSHNEAINLLLCEETIPGSPAPSRECSELKLNVHPTDSDIKHIPMDIECSLPSTTVTTIIGIGGHGDDGDKMKADPNTPTSSPRDSMSQDDSGEDVRKIHGTDSMSSTKKRHHSRKHSESGTSEPSMKRRRQNLNNPKRSNAGSDSDDNSDANISQRSNRSSRPCQYNFLVDLDPAMNPNQRIAILNKTIAELRKTYNQIKAELASIDRRRKKLRRREREKKMQQKINS